MALRPLPPNSPLPRSTRFTRVVVGGGLWAAALAAGLGACNREATSSAPTTLTAATPAPETTVPTSRTIDNAGWVDNGGRTSTETARSQFSGMRATEVGSERITGTPGSGYIPGRLPLAVTPTGTESPNGPTREPPARSSPPRGPSVFEALPRVASAYCDGENACGHVGTGRRWPSAEACRNESAPTGSNLDGPECAVGVDTTALASCLAGLRGRACDDTRSAADLPSCQSSALCP